MRVLEFKRTNDFFKDSFERAILHKWVKYQPLVENLREEYPEWDIKLLVFIQGDRGLFDEIRWQTNWDSMNLPQSKFTKMCVDASTTAQDVATDILAVYNAALLNMH